MSDVDRFITAVTPVYVGSDHDFSIFKEEKIQDLLPTKKPIYLDTGFEGICKLREDLDIRKPKKKRKKKKLNGGERLGNRLISRERVKVEHAIGGIKTFRIVYSIFRGITKAMDDSIQIACGLWNLHVRSTAKSLTQQAVEI